MMAGHARDTLRPLATSAGSQVLVLPTLGKSFVLYPLVSVSGNNGKLPSPSEALEIMSRVLRRARLSGLDVLSGTWHSLTTSPNGQNSLYRLGLKAFGAGKQGSSALSFFRSLPRNSNDKALKILYPESVPVRDIQIQVALWLKGLGYTLSFRLVISAIHCTYTSRQTREITNDRQSSGLWPSLP